MVKILVVLLIMAANTVIGCASTWSKPGVTESEFRRDCYECQRDAAMVGQSPAPYRPAIYPSTTYGTTQSASDDLMALSRNMSQLSARESMFERCMQSKGYSQE